MTNFEKLTQELSPLKFIHYMTDENIYHNGVAQGCPYRGTYTCPASTKCRDIAGDTQEITCDEVFATWADMVVEDERRKLKENNNEH